MVAARRPRRPSALTAPPESGPLAQVWARLRRLPVDDRNRFTAVDEDGQGISIPCGRTRHAAHVAGGRLFLEHHDVDAEVALLALGGELPSCLVYLAAWDHAADDVAFLQAWGDDVESDELLSTREDWEGNYWESWPAEPPAGRVLFGPRLQRTLAVIAARRAAAEADTGRLGRWYALQRATQTRARRAFVASLAGVDAHPRPDALVPVRIRLDLDGDGRIQGRLARLGSSVEIALPVDWLWTVWDTGHALVENHFVLACGADGGMRTVNWRPSGSADGEHRPSVVVRH